MYKYRRNFYKNIFIIWSNAFTINVTGFPLGFKQIVGPAVNEYKKTDINMHILQYGKIFPCKLRLLLFRIVKHLSGAIFYFLGSYLFRPKSQPVYRVMKLDALK